VEYLLLRQHVSALALGHHQVLNCASEETIQCSICNEISLIAWPLTPPTNDTEQTLLNTYLAWNTPRLSIPTAHPLHLVHNHAHFTYRVLMSDIAYDLDFIILASPEIVNGHAINEISLRIVHCIVSSEAQFFELMMTQCKGRNMLS